VWSKNTHDSKQEKKLQTPIPFGKNSFGKKTDPPISLSFQPNPERLEGLFKKTDGYYD